MYRKEINQLKVAVDALDALIEGTSNIYTSIDSISLNNEPLARSVDSLLYAKQQLIAQVATLETAQAEAQLALTMEQ